MIDWTKGMISVLLATDWAVFYLYFIPWIFSALGAAMRTVREVRRDYQKRREQDKKEHGFYRPTVTIGTIVGRCFLSVIPVANVFYAIYLLFSEILDKVVTFFGELFDAPIVPERKSGEG